MDGHRFDRMTKALAGGVSRRGVLGGAAAGLAAGLLGRQSGEAACGPDQINRRGRCLCRTTGRPPGADGLCPCARGQTRCGDACVNTSRDDGNCGGCDQACAADEVCRAGVCVCVDDGQACGVAVCGTATTNCGATVNCGPLDGACPAETPCCLAGVCQAAPPPTLADCQGRCTGAVSATVEVCGQPTACPSCLDCPDLGCPGGASSSASDGPAGIGSYCVVNTNIGSCSGSHMDCPNPEENVCSGTGCFPICTGTS